MIPISVVELGEDVETLVLEVIRSGMIAQGPKVAALEAAFAELIDVDHVVAVNNGTTALIAALQALGIGPGDEVITSPFTFVATLNAILGVGATARFADISLDDFNVSSTSMAALVSPSTAALLPVHLYGQAADMPAIEDIATLHGLAIIEDAAQAHGAAVRGRAAGSWGVGCFSLYATKNLTSGEGGLVTTNDPTVADRLRVLRNQGMRERYVYEMAGNNYRMTDLQAAVCLPQIARYDQQVAARQRNADYLSQALSGLSGLITPQQLEGRRHVWHQYTLVLGEDCPIDRTELAHQLTAAGVGNGFYYPRLVFDYDCYRENPCVVSDDVPTAERIASRCISIPVHARLSEPELEQIATAVIDAIGGR